MHRQSLKKRKIRDDDDDDFVVTDDDSDDKSDNDSPDELVPYQTSSEIIKINVKKLTERLWDINPKSMIEILKENDKPVSDEILKAAVALPIDKRIPVYEKIFQATTSLGSNKLQLLKQLENYLFPPKDPFLEKIQKLDTIDETTKTKILKAYENIKTTEDQKGSQALSIIKNFPFGCYQEKKYNPKKILEYMNKYLYGLEEEKLSIIETVVSSQFSSNKNVCLVGTPGTGKTSLVKAICEACDIPFTIISCSGISDTAFFKGMSRVWMGSAPGCIVNSLINMNTLGGVLIFDEIDKCPSAIQQSLLNVIDPAQYKNFEDLFLPGIPIDLSQTSFFFTANSVDHIDQALINRFFVIKLKNYTIEEYRKIVRDYVIKKYSSLYSIDIKFSDDAIQKLSAIASSKGIRNAEKIIERIYKMCHVIKNYPESHPYGNKKLPDVITSSFLRDISDEEKPLFYII